MHRNFDALIRRIITDVKIGNKSSIKMQKIKSLKNTSKSFNFLTISKREQRKNNIKTKTKVETGPKQLFVLLFKRSQNCQKLLLLFK